MERGAHRWVVDSAAWNPDPFQFALFLSFIPASDHPHILRFIKIEDRKQALLSRLMQYILVHKVLEIPYSEILIKRTKEGKPYVANSMENPAFPNFNFNVSHHGDLVALASEPLCLVGLDIMAHDSRVKESPDNYLQNFASCFTELEWASINKVGSRCLLDQFYRYWCMKEAYTKAIGIGLGFKLQRAEFYFVESNPWSDIPYMRLDGQEKDDWRFHLHHLGNHHWACVAKGPPSEAVESFKKTFQLQPDSVTLMSALEEPEMPFQTIAIEELVSMLRN